MPSHSTLLYQTSIRVVAEFRAQHRWLNCPFEQVAFLRNWHRHVFKVALELWVSHDDRDEEFFMVQSQLLERLAKWEGAQLDMSCEMMAMQLTTAFLDRGHLVKSVTVSEDGENSATIQTLNVRRPAAQEMLIAADDVFSFASPSGATSV